ncbi:MAG: hypothetical protein K8U03_05340 [Planctomycetia bacterium]|nr:hypothetical protein [Planctomycetia bacterium]
MSRSRHACLLAIAALLPASAFAENWFSNTYRGFCNEFRSNNQWPEQFLDHDRAAARAPFTAMVAAGWRSQNTLSAYHFDDIAGDLNETGRLKMKSILFETPVDWRSIYVLRADDPAVTTVRVKAVQAYGLGLLQGEALPPLMVTTVEPRGARGDVTNGVHQRVMENAPVPVLPPAQRDTGSSSGS